ncbi:hypothetical protein SORBI_3001G476201 [Sorghum bicolor]|uniref:Uncharacterized protein n=1 Tax=Sorghum bicolor TaxID=4558 RepID=A0A1Z5SAZ6_SORBI|nr:hypothetical protein SORBI_3001G476201 [Sorghum bicolor]
MVHLHVRQELPHVRVRVWVAGAHRKEKTVVVKLDSCGGETWQALCRQKRAPPSRQSSSEPRFRSRPGPHGQIKVWRTATARGPKVRLPTAMQLEPSLKGYSSSSGPCLKA